MLITFKCGDIKKIPRQARDVFHKNWKIFLKEIETKWREWRKE